MKKIVLFVFISIILICIGCDLSFDNTQQDQNETTVKSQNTIDFFYSINQDNSISLTPVVSWEGVEKNTLQYVWVTADDPYITKENPTITVGEGAKSTSVALYVFNGEQKKENVLGITSKTISLTGTFPTDTGQKKLFLFAKEESNSKHPDDNPKYMYFALQIKGTSKHGTFRTEATKDSQFTYAYPRSVQYEHKSSNQDRYTSMYAQATSNLASLGVGYTEATGFSPSADGTSFSMPFYLGDNKCRIKMNGTSTLRYSFANFVVWDTVVDTFLGNWGWPVLIRCPSSAPLTITIPMNEYDEKKHKNIALLTVTFNDDAKKTDFEYDVKFDRFVNKNE